MLKPLILDRNKVIAIVGLRKKDNAGKDLEYVKLISAKFENNSWNFGIKDGWVYSFSYADDTYPRLTNYEMVQHVLSNLMLEGFFKHELSDKSIFKSSWFVF